MSEDKEKYVPQYKKFGLTPTLFVKDDASEQIEMSAPVALEDVSGDDNSNTSDSNINLSLNYALSVDDVVVSLSTKEDIEEQILLLTMGEHSSYISQEVSLDRISVFKKINIKVGVFLEE